MVIKGFHVGKLLRRTAREIGEDNVSTLSASAAFDFFFSLFPLLLFLSPLLSVVGDKRQTIEWVMTQLTSTLTRAQADAMRPVLEKIVFSSNAPGAMSVGFLLAAWAGSNVFGTLMDALNRAYDVKETRSWIRQQITRLVAFVLGTVIIALSTIVFLRGEVVADWLGSLLHLTRPAIWTWKIVQFPLAFGGVAVLAFLTYYYLPNVKQKRGAAALSAVITTALWIAATLLFRVYVNHFPPNPAYGLIGAVIILLTWMYYTMFVLLCGGELASELHHGTGATDPDRGAVYAGRVVTEAPSNEGSLS